MRYKLFVLVLFFFLGCALMRYEKVKTKNKKLVDKIEESLEVNVQEDEVRGCPNYDRNNLLKYYRQEISKFPLNQALAEVNQWSEKFALNDSDTIVLILFYPAVGFDTEQGYVTEYYIYGRGIEEGIVGKFDNEASPFQTSRHVQSIIKEKLRSYENYQNGCENGLLAISYLSPSLEVRRCRTVVGLNIFN